MSSEFDWTQLRELSLRITKGTTPTKGEGFVASGVNYIKSESITADGSIDVSKFAFIDSKTHQKLARSQLRAGNVLFSMAGVYLGKTAVVLPEHLPANTNQAVGIVTLDESKADPYFVHYSLQSPSCRAWVLRSAAQSAQPNFNLQEIGDLKVPDLPLERQKKIVSILRMLDDRLILLRETNATLEAIAQALFKSWFVDFDPVRAKMEGRAPEGMNEATAALFPDSFEESELGLVPKGWEVRGIDETCELGRGSSPRPIQKFMGGDVPWIKIADATASDGMFVFETKETIIKEGVRNSVVVRPGDLIMSNSASCGITVFVELDGCIHDGWLYFKNYQHISKYFLFFWLRKIADHLVRIADGSVQKNLNIALVSSQNIISPSIEVIHEFDNLVGSLLDRIRENCIQVQTLADLRDTLLPRLISGRLRLSDD